jgi:hypothetical protein
MSPWLQSARCVVSASLLVYASELPGIQTVGPDLTLEGGAAVQAVQEAECRPDDDHGEIGGFRRTTEGTALAQIFSGNSGSAAESGLR